MKPILTGLFLLACSFLSAQPETEAGHLEVVQRMLKESEVFSPIFTGFALFDPQREAFLLEQDADKYFTPASNTKIFTLYTALQILGDSLPAFRYAQYKDTTVVWGTGNPLFLNPGMPADTAGLNLLRRSGQHLLLSVHNYHDDRFGPGWAWDDYSYSYQAEKSPFPIYGNLAWFERTKVREGFRAYPPFFQDKLVYNPKLDNRRARVVRQEHQNIFEYNDRALTGFPFQVSAPFRASPALIAALLSDTLGRKVQPTDLSLLPPLPVKTWHQPIPDTLYQRLMKDSDNFIAEQLLLACSEKLYGRQETAAAIRFAQDSLFAAFPDRLQWRDGSGLSRYNLFTPRSVASVLHLIAQQKGMGWVQRIFPAGGQSGTLERDYAGPGGQPYVFAKTGTLSNKHCLSGYLVTDSGRVLIFSFMNNNYTNGTAPVKKAMEQILSYLRRNL